MHTDDLSGSIYYHFHCNMTLTQFSGLENYYCPSIYLQHENIKRFGLCTVERSFNEAETSCNLDGGNLALIGSAEEQNFLETHFNLNAAQWIGKYRKHFVVKLMLMLIFIIGLNDIDQEGSFVWTAEPNLPVEFTKWDNQEPNDFWHFDLGSAEDCTTMREHGEWNDNNCAKLFPYLCQIGTNNSILD